MESIAKADIFFFVSTISVAIVAVILIAVLIQASIILRSVNKTLRGAKLKYIALTKFFESFTRKNK